MSNVKVKNVVNKILEGTAVRNAITEGWFSDKSDDSCGFQLTWGDARYKTVEKILVNGEDKIKYDSPDVEVSCNPGDVIAIQTYSNKYWWVLTDDKEECLGYGKKIQFTVPSDAKRWGGLSYWDHMDTDHVYILLTDYNGIHGCTGWTRKIKIDTEYLNINKKTNFPYGDAVDDEEDDLDNNDVLQKKFENWWDEIKEDFLEGGEEFFGFNPNDEFIEWKVYFYDDGSVDFYGDVGGVGIKLKDFKDLLRSSGINVGIDVKVSKDSYSGGCKVEFKKMTPKEFIDKLL